MIFHGITDTGKIRKVNEDSYLIKEISDRCLIAIVADGMGGHKGGNRASKMAVEKIVKIIESKSAKFKKFSDKNYAQLLTDAVKSANAEIYEFANSNGELVGMGTTAVVCVVYADKYYAANVGDSRMYMCNTDISQITKDHSYVNELVKMGLITEEQARFHPQKNIITRALGTESNVDVDIYTGEFLEGSAILLCSDGLSNMVDDNELYSTVMTEKTAEDAVNVMVKKANLAGGKDNITALLIKNISGGAQK